MDQKKGVAAALDRSSGRAMGAISQINEILVATMESGDYFAFSLLVCILKAQSDYMWDLVSKHLPEGTLRNMKPIAKVMREETSRNVEREATELLKAGKRIWD